MITEQHTFVNLTLCRPPSCFAVHPVDREMGPEHRLFMGLMYWRSSADDNQYAHPLPWVPILDVESRKVLTQSTIYHIIPHPS